MLKNTAIKEALSHLFTGIELLKSAFPNRKFTIDGRLVGDIGEVIAALEYDLAIDEISKIDYDATTTDGRRVQIKATFKDSLTFKRTPDYFLGFKLYRDGTFEEIYNGPGHLIFDEYQHRRGIGEVLLSFPNARLKAISDTIPEKDKIQLRSQYDG